MDERPSAAIDSFLLRSDDSRARTHAGRGGKQGGEGEDAKLGILKGLTQGGPADGGLPSGNPYTMAECAGKSLQKLVSAKLLHGLYLAPGSIATFESSPRNIAASASSIEDNHWNMRTHSTVGNS